MQKQNYHFFSGLKGENFLMTTSVRRKKKMHTSLQINLETTVSNINEQREVFCLNQQWQLHEKKILFIKFLKNLFMKQPHRI